MAHNVLRNNCTKEKSYTFARYDKILRKHYRMHEVLLLVGTIDEFCVTFKVQMTRLCYDNNNKPYDKGKNTEHCASSTIIHEVINKYVLCIECEHKESGTHGLNENAFNSPTIYVSETNSSNLLLTRRVVAMYCSVNIITTAKYKLRLKVIFIRCINNI
jgi:hypothetical protein